MEKLIWKDVNGYEGVYQISNYGDVIRLPCRDARGHLRKMKVIKAHKNRCGYLHLGLYKDGKETKHLVHRLVAEAFLCNPNGYTDVNHKDEDKKNNAVSNLEWCCRSYNCRYGTAQARRVATRKMNEEEKLCAESF